ncbi:FabD/lysophospholipase-like protein [Mycena sanguinolenta]|uniref:FabD/lysophospholipase-like protein n=1 Tax=Mycena sanguinolenta TaxID=230812 RepID=A0A8H6XFU4_9AGAR|nr:FabD/lysophospholipase-like protein [Mycena sanguinolenta]
MVEYSLLILRAEKLSIRQPPEFYITVADESCNESKSSIARGTTPKWNLKSKISNSGNFTIKVFWRYDRKEELMGQCNVSIPELLQQQGAPKTVPLELKLKNKSSGWIFVQLSADRETTPLPVPPVPTVQTRSPTPQNRTDREAVESNARNMPPHNRPSKQLSAQPSTKEKAAALPVPLVLPSQSRSLTPQNGKDRPTITPVSPELQLKNKSSGKGFVRLSTEPVSSVPPVQTRSPTPQNRKDREVVASNVRSKPYNKPLKQLSVQPDMKEKATLLPVPSVLPSQSKSPTPQNRKDRQAVVKSGKDNRSYETLNIQISGGQGGNGGNGGLLGGHGGTGEGPTLHYNIRAEHFTMNTTNMGSAVNTVQKSSAMVQASQAINHCPPPSQIFYGRQTILESMHQFFVQHTGKQKRYVLYGLGGAGKTQIALKFIEEWTHFTDQLLVDASNPDTIEAGLKNIAMTKQAGNSFQDGLIWLASKPEEWLLFFDNADDPTVNLNQFFPKCNHGNVIITSRNHGARIHGAHSEVSNMEESDAVALLLKCAHYETSSTNEPLAAEIVKALWYFPLAIVQAGAFISESEALGTYLDLFLKNRNDLLRRKSTQTHDDYAWAVYTTWEMSFDKLSSPAAMFLQLCSFLHQDDISEGIFSRAANFLVGPGVQGFNQNLKKAR